MFCSSKTGIAKRRAKMNEETIFPRRMFMYRYSYCIPCTYTKQNERHIVFIPLLEIGDFVFRIKQKTLF